MGGKQPTQIRCTETDPSLEFDLFASVRIRLVEDLSRRGYEPLESERVALYLVESARPSPRFLRLLTAPAPPADDEVIDALGKVIDGLPALEKAQSILLRVETDETD